MDPHAGQVRRDEFQREVTHPPQVGDHVVQPATGQCPCGPCGLGTHDVGGTEEVIGEPCPPGLDLCGVAVRDCIAEPCQVEGFRCGRHGHGAARCRGDRCHGHVRAAVVHEISVDLVADDDEPVPRRDAGEVIQLGTREHVAGGVLRVAQDHHPRGLAREQAVEGVMVERHRAVLDAGRHGDHPATGLLDRGEERRVRRHVHDHAVTGGRDHVQHRLDGLHHVVPLADEVRARRPAMPPLHVVHERTDRTGAVLLVTGGVPEVAQVQHRLQVRSDLRCRAVVHVRHPGGEQRCVLAPLVAGFRLQPGAVE